MQNGDHESAISILERVLKSNPYNFSVLTSKGHAEKTLGKTDQAIESYKNAYKIKPDHGEAFFLSKISKLINFQKLKWIICDSKWKELIYRLRKAYFHFCVSARL